MTTSAAKPTPAAAPSPRWKRVLGRIWLLPLVAALGIAASHPPIGFGPLVFVGYGAWVLYLMNRPNARSAFWVGWLIGLLAFGVNLFFLSQMVSEPGTEWLTRGIWVIATIICAFPGACFSGLTAWFARRRSPLATAALGPFIWCGFEWFRYSLAGGCPLVMPGYALADIPLLLQMADVGSIHLINFFIVLVASLLAAALHSYQLGQIRHYRLLSFLMIAAFLPPLLYGLNRVNELSTEIRPDGPKVAMIQPGIPQDLKMQESAANSASTRWQTHADLSRQVLRQHPDTDLVVWSETATPYAFSRAWMQRMGPNDAPDDTLLRDIYDPKLLARDHLRTNLIVGATIAPSEAELNQRFAYLTPTEKERARFNTALWLDAEGRPRGHHDKVWLVPGGEFLPARESLLGDLVKAYASGLLTNFAPSTVPGNTFETFTLNARDGRNYRFSMSICYEFAYPQLYRDLHWDSEQGVARNVHFNTLLSNEAWYQGGAELDQALVLSQVRAIENRATMLRATNDGITAVIDPLGRVVSKLEVDGKDRQVQGTLVQHIPVRSTPAPTLFHRIGLWPWQVLGWLTLVTGCGVLALSWIGAIRRRFRRASDAEVA